MVEYARDPTKVSPISKVKYPTKPKEKSKRTKLKVVKNPKKVSKEMKTTRTTLGKVHLNVEHENWQRDADIPQYAVEVGKDISDHVKERATVLTITGVIFKDKKHTVAEKIRGLEKYKQDGTFLTYAGRRTGRNFLINKFSYESEAQIGNGHKFTIILQEVRVAGKKPKTSKKGAKGKTKSGTVQTANSKGTKYHTTVRGDTYIGLGKKYGTDWKKIKGWAGYPDRRIPIGIKIKVR